jgi:hypothetical protein
MGRVMLCYFLFCFLSFSPMILSIPSLIFRQFHKLITFPVLNAVANFQERMQLRRSLIELEDQNVQNGIEVRTYLLS